MLDRFLVQLGVFGVIAAAAIAIARPFFQAWLSRRIEAAVEEGVQKRLATHQLELDKDLERHRASLATDADRLRSGLERDTIDYGLYAAKRHDAVAGLFAEYLRAEVLVTDMTEFSDPRSAEEAEEFRRARRERALKARNDAYEGYFKYALYLSDVVDPIAIAVRDQFHAASLPYVLHDEPATEIVRDKLRLRQLMLDYQNAARADLARGATLPTSPAPPALSARGEGPQR